MLKGAPIALIRVRRNIVTPVLINGTRVDEVFMQMVNVLEHIALHGTRNSYIVYETALIYISDEVFTQSGDQIHTLDE